MSTTYIVLRSNLPLSNNQFQFPLIADKDTSTAHCWKFSSLSKTLLSTSYKNNIKILRCDQLANEITRKTF